MKRIILVLIILSIPFFTFAQVNFGSWFQPKTLRVDYVLAGNADTSFIFLDQLKEEPHWGGPQKNLIDKFNYGDYKFIVYDSATYTPLYSQGFSTLFSEWRSTREAKNTNRSFAQTAVFPYPLKTVFFQLFERNKKNEFVKKFGLYINPQSCYISSEVPDSFKTDKIYYNGDPAKKVDIAILADGYTASEMGKFLDDAKRFSENLFATPPFDSYKKSFNIWAVESVSKQTGADIPGAHVWKKTVLNSTFYTLGSDRYLMTYDTRTLHDIASLVPYDQIYILVNSPVYGGGGIYNYYCTSSSGDIESSTVFVHEFGHGFAGLADEYVDDDLSYENLFSKGVEPWQPNITTLVHFDKKWQKMVTPGIPVPTPENPDYMGKTGAFEGAGYVAKGVYRPTPDCRMRTNTAKGFCPVCQKAIVDMIKFYTGE